MALLYGQLSGASSLREIIGGLESHAVRFYHLGSRLVQRSTLAVADAFRPSMVLHATVSRGRGTRTRGLRRKFAEGTHLIDSTKFRLNGLSAHCVRFSIAVCNVRVRVIYDLDAEAPD